jgi:hypothetical protein
MYSDIFNPPQILPYIIRNMFFTLTNFGVGRRTCMNLLLRTVHYIYHFKFLEEYNYSFNVESKKHSCERRFTKDHLTILK